MEEDGDDVGGSDRLGGGGGGGGDGGHGGAHASKRSSRARERGVGNGDEGGWGGDSRRGGGRNSGGGEHSLQNSPHQGEEGDTLPVLGASVGRGSVGRRSVGSVGGGGWGELTERNGKSTGVYTRGDAILDAAVEVRLKIKRSNQTLAES